MERGREIQKLLDVAVGLLLGIVLLKFSRRNQWFCTMLNCQLW